MLAFPNIIINLGLSITEKRPDGYHNLETVFYPVALEDALENFAGCVLVVSHDRWFLDRIATHILAFEDEGTVCFVEGTYSDYEEDRRKRLGKEADQPHRMKFRRLTR